MQKTDADLELSDPETVLQALYLKRSRYRTRPVEVTVEFALEPQTVQTLEGPVRCSVGDAIVTGTAGERWPVPHDVFERKYQPAGEQHPGSPGRYSKRTAFVEATQLNRTFSVPLSEKRGSLQGSPGDWCVWYAPGDAAIVAQNLFPELYEPVEQATMNSL